MLRFRIRYDLQLSTVREGKQVCRSPAVELHPLVVSKKSIEILNERQAVRRIVGVESRAEGCRDRYLCRALAYLVEVASFEGSMEIVHVRNIGGSRSTFSNVLSTIVLQFVNQRT